MAYREQIQHKVLDENPGMNNKLVSVIAAKMWNEEPEEVKQYWRERAQQLKIEHMIKYPDYKFAPKKKQPKNNNKSNSVCNNSKVIKKSDSKILTEELAKELLNGSENVNNNITATFNNRTSSLLWGHHRSTSVDSISSWDSSAPSTPPSYIESDSPLLLPTTSDYQQFSDNYLAPHDFLDCSSSPLQYTPNSSTCDDDWNKIISSFENNFFDTLLPGMEFGQSMQIDASATAAPENNGGYYLEDDDLEFNEFNDGFFPDPNSSQILDSFVMTSQLPNEFQQPLY